MHFFQNQGRVILSYPIKQTLLLQVAVGLQIGALRCLQHSTSCPERCSREKGKADLKAAAPRVRREGEGEKPWGTPLHWGLFPLAHCKTPWSKSLITLPLYCLPKHWACFNAPLRKLSPKVHLRHASSSLQQISVQDWCLAHCCSSQQTAILDKLICNWMGDSELNRGIQSWEDKY